VAGFARSIYPANHAGASPIFFILFFYPAQSLKVPKKTEFEDLNGLLLDAFQQSLK
jgi:hypothetical protein